jgi:hypothetical protein
MMTIDGLNPGSSDPLNGSRNEVDLKETWISISKVTQEKFKYVISSERIEIARAGGRASAPYRKIGHHLVMKASSLKLYAMIEGTDRQ